MKTSGTIQSASPRGGDCARALVVACIFVPLVAAHHRAYGQSAATALDVEVPRNPAPPALAADREDAVASGAGYDSAQALVPPGVEGNAFPSSYGGYCYVGPHPADTRVTSGVPWDATPGQHIRPYAPIDLRLFSYRDGCYYFIGDPRDFGYSGQASSYYGAHPILAAYGGGWCFMMGGHSHVWAPWSPYFTVVGPWYYWRGPYDPFFWAYWPYYSTYYRAYYPHYYGGGRFYRGGGGYRTAPPFGRGFQGSSAFGGAAARGAPAVRGAASAPPVFRGGPSAVAPFYPSSAASPMRQAPPPARGGPAPSGGGFHGGGFHGGRR